MFIHYCDGCNVRVDEGEAVSVGQKVFCKTCAIKQGIRAGSGTHASGASTQPLSSGLHRGSPQRPNSRRSPATGQRQVVAQRTAAPRTGSQIRSSPSGFGSNRAAQPDNSKIAVWSLAGAGIILAVLGVILMSRSKTPPVETETAVAENKRDTSPAKDIDKKVPQPRIEPIVKPPNPVQIGKKIEPEVVVKAEPPKITKEAEAEIEDIREGSARRELAKIQELQKDPKTNAFEYRRKVERFASTYRSTKAGQDGSELLKSLPELAQRPPDAAENTEPGLLAKLYEKTFQGDTINGVNLKDCKFISSKVMSTVELPNQGAVAAAFGRGENMAVEFTGFVEVPEDGTYSFYTNSDDGSVLYLGEALLGNADGSHGMLEAGDSIPLKKGKHRYRVSWYQGSGEAGIVLSWAGPNIAKQTVPASVFSHTRE